MRLKLLEHAVVDLEALLEYRSFTDPHNRCFSQISAFQYSLLILDNYLAQILLTLLEKEFRTQSKVAEQLHQQFVKQYQQLVDFGINYSVLGTDYPNCNSISNPTTNDMRLRESLYETLVALGQPETVKRRACQIL